MFCFCDNNFLFGQSWRIYANTHVPTAIADIHRGPALVIEKYRQYANRIWVFLLLCLIACECAEKVYQRAIGDGYISSQLGKTI